MNCWTRGQDAAADDHHHEDARSLGRVLAQPLDGEVEDTAPHDRRTETAQDEEQGADGHLRHLKAVADAVTGHGHGDRLGDEDGQHDEEDGDRRNDDQLRTARDPAADEAAERTADQHQQPIDRSDGTADGGTVQQEACAALRTVGRGRS